MAMTPETARAEAYAAGVRDMQISHYRELQDEVWKALHQISSLQSGLRNLHVLLDTDGHVPAALIRPLVKNLAETSTRAERVLTGCGTHWENVWKPTERSAIVAQRVFTIPELCENILNYLPANLDLYRAMRTNQAMAAAVRGSPSIQKALGFAPADKGHWYTPFEYQQFGGYGWNHDHGFTCDRNVWLNEPPGFAAVTANFVLRTPEATLRGIMAPFRDVQICTPPIREMKCHVDCCDGMRGQTERGGNDGEWDEAETRALPAPKPITPLKNPQGLTVGDLFQATIRLKEEHRLCPYAHETRVNLETGSAQVDVSFTGQVQLSPDDPVVIAQQKPVDDNDWPVLPVWVPDERELQRQAQTQMIAGYVKAKTDALMHGMPIPTLVEYASRLAAEQIETGRDLVDEASDLLQSATIDGQAAEASGWN
ncbi:hypothetical protein LTR56_001390 [Elasticomyces elasticus]|nr:hypothetical protein LTR56_001390 [Elasticomyces elasticus]KAK3668686.1 hypothetical protein LTR22_000573 [Elasticomyces elasticus]KAK4932038.1 hypothetical protein LTR49_001725 [Elasticomyces elasticus]KAK5768430.1 hypothetical protein LTS12_001218 [Elasticomyces elasticus]